MTGHAANSVARAGSPRTSQLRQTRQQDMHRAGGVALDRLRQGRDRGTRRPADLPERPRRREPLVAARALERLDQGGHLRRVGPMALTFFS